MLGEVLIIAFNFQIRLQVLHSRTRLAIPERNKPMPVQHYPLNLSEPHTATNRNSSHGAPHEKSQHPLNLSKHIGTNQNLAEPGPPTSLNVFDRRNLDAQASNNPGMGPNVPWAIYTAMERSFAQERSERQRLAEQLQQTQMELQEARIQLMVRILRFFNLTLVSKKYI